MSERERSQSRTTSVGGDDKAELRLLWRRVLLRLSVLYFLPFLILTVFFHMQYRALGRSSERSNLHSLALRQATALDVALLQRLRESQGSAPELDREVMEALLAQTRVEVEGYRFSVSGDHSDSQGELSDAQQRSEAAFLLPPRTPRVGAERRATESEGTHVYGYAWLESPEARGWAVIVLSAPDSAASTDETLGELYLNVGLVALVLFLLCGFVMTMHARMAVQRLWSAREKERELSGQLVHASKLASVGQLAAGIAHEINNPLAVVAEEVGLLQDLLNPELGGCIADEDLAEHLDTMEEAVFRGRDVTRKLLGFVRQSDIRIGEHDVHDILDEVSDDYLGRELELSGIDIERKYDADPSTLVTDRNSLAQILLNLMKNAVDAMSGAGTLTLRTAVAKETLTVSVTDTGPGMTREAMEKIFTPFYSTKAPGKGTGLGLSVSQGILETLGGEMYVESEVGEGTTFTLEFPLETE